MRLRCRKDFEDYGLDLAIFTFDEAGLLERGAIWVQLKATDHLRTSRDDRSVLVRIDRRDALAWIAEGNPVFLVLYDGIGDRAFWLDIQGYFGDDRAFAKLHGQTVTIPIPKKNLVSAKAMREFARAKAAIRPPGAHP